MIRDPSDGSVREKPMPGEIPVMPGSKPGIDSGLPTGSTKPENLARLEKSREWMKNYRLGTTTSTEISTVTTGDQRAEKDAT